MNPLSTCAWFERFERKEVMTWEDRLRGYVV